MTLERDVLTEVQPRTSATFTLSQTGNLNPVHSDANRVVFYIWNVSNIDVRVSDTTLSRVAGWSDHCDLLSSDRFQNARITATADITLGDATFTAYNMLPIIGDYVSYFIMNY